MKPYWLSITLLAVAGCGKVNPIEQPMSCTIACSADTDCPSDLSCGALGLCTQGDETCSCNAGEFIACDADGAVFCNAAANGVTTESCGVPGCNAVAERCNACLPETNVCNGGKTALDHCGSDGTVTQSDACPAGCTAATAGDHCGYIEPAWLPNVCEDAPTIAQATITSTLDTTQAASCTGGIVVVGGTTFCIVRAGKIDIGNLKVTGANAIAFVADDELTVTGILDVSADGATSGPGPSGAAQGGSSLNSSYVGAGGAGFAQGGAPGGGNETGTVFGSPGGAPTDRLTTDRFTGGARGGNSLCGNGITACFNSIDFSGGGAGGGALLIACRGTVSVTGTIDAGGGGGTGGGDHATGTTISQGGGPGGGSGGFVVLQGVQVQITGSLYANGGGGGAGCGTDNCRGLFGSDGLRATTGALGGDPAGNTVGGGIGGSVSNTPGSGEQTFASASAGAVGGGGSMGRFRVFTPAGVTPLLTPAAASPAPVASTTSILVK